MKFLIVRLSSLGDIIHTLPVVNRLRYSFLDAQVDWLVGEKGTGILPLIKEINTIYELNGDSIKRIQQQKYDYVIDVQGLLKTAFISRACLGKKVIGFKGTREFADLFYDIKVDVGNVFETKEHVVDLNLKLLDVILGIKECKTNFLIPKIESPEKIEKVESGKNLMILPSTTWKSKMWLLDYWKELIAKIEGYKVFVVAANSDLEFISPLLKMLDEEKMEYVNMVGKTNLKDLTYLIQKMEMVVGLDSGGIHLASAISNDYSSPKVYGIYGPTSSFRNGIYGEISNGLYEELDCIRCRKKRCPLGHHRCMTDLTADRVLSALEH